MSSSQQEDYLALLTKGSVRPFLSKENYSSCSHRVSMARCRAHLPAWHSQPARCRKFKFLSPFCPVRLPSLSRRQLQGHMEIAWQLLATDARLCSTVSPPALAASEFLWLPGCLHHCRGEGRARRCECGVKPLGTGTAEQTY